MTPKTSTISIVGRLLVALSVVFVLLLGYSYWHFIEHESNERRIASAYVLDFSKQVEQVLMLHRKGLQSFTYDYSWWDDMVDFVDGPSVEKWKAMAGVTPARYGVDMVWVTDAEGRQVFGYDVTEARPNLEIPFKPEEFSQIFDGDPFPVFFANYGDAIIEVSCSPIQSRTDKSRSTSPTGYLIAAKAWQNDVIDSLNQSLASKLAIDTEIQGENGIEQAFADAESGEVSVIKIGRDYSGHPVFTYRLNHIVPGVHHETTLLDWHSLFVFILMALVCTIVFFALYIWVIAPLSVINRALETENPEFDSRIRKYGREWARLATLVATSISQKKALKEEVERRKEAEEALVESELALRQGMESKGRLGRDLHDGIIQSVYAVGLQLETARLKMNTNPQVAQATLSEVRSTLNGLIANIRGFIRGIADEKPRMMGFREGLEQLSKTVGFAGLNLKVEIEQDAIEVLNEAQENEFFYITQELVSNAFRHAKASHIRVKLSLEENSVHCTISDDGIGDCEKITDATGNGLKNIQYRTDILGATTSYLCGPAEGCTIQITLHIPKLIYDDCSKCD